MKRTYKDIIEVHVSVTIALKAFYKPQVYVYYRGKSLLESWVTTFLQNHMSTSHTIRAVRAHAQEF